MSRPPDLHPDVTVYCCGRHLMFESLNCDHISKYVQTVTHTERPSELMEGKKGQMYEGQRTEK